MKCLLLSTALLFSCIIITWAQRRNIDSLLVQIKTSPPDSNKVKAIFELCTLTKRENIDDDMANYASQALSISEKEDYKWGIGISYYAIGLCEYAKRDYEQALNDVARAEKILEDLGDKKNSGRCLYLQANLLYEIGRYPESVRFYNNALETWQSIGYEALEGSCYNDLGGSYEFMGNTSKAIECYHKAMQISEALNDKKVMAKSLQYLGSTYDDFGDYENAMKDITASSAINLELGNEFDFAQNNNTIGELLLEKGHGAAALQKFYRSLKIYEKKGGPSWGLIWTYEDIGKALENQGDSADARGEKKMAAVRYNEALNNYTISLQKAEKIKNRSFIPGKKVAIGKIYFKIGKISRARKYLLDAAKLLGKLGSTEDMAPCYLYLSKIDSAEGNKEKAYDDYKSYVLYRDSRYTNEASQKLAMFKIQAEVEKREQEINLLSTKNKLETAIAEKQTQQKKFIYGGIAVLLIFGSYILSRYIKRKKLQNQEEILNERLRISRELHDELGSTLSGIAMYTHVTKEQIKANRIEDVERSLNNMQQSAGDMVNKLNDIVWLVNPEKDSLQKLMVRLEEYADNMAAIKNIEIKIAIPENLRSINIPVKNRRNIYLFCKEAINNAVKYSDASEIRLDMREVSNKRIEISLGDNGKGFDITALKKGNGLINMQKRAEDINGTFLLQSSPGQGTKVSLAFKIT